MYSVHSLLLFMLTVLYSDMYMVYLLHLSVIFDHPYLVPSLLLLYYGNFDCCCL